MLFIRFAITGGEEGQAKLTYCCSLSRETRKEEETLTHTRGGVRKGGGASVCKSRSELLLLLLLFIPPPFISLTFLLL